MAHVRKKEEFNENKTFPRSLLSTREKYPIPGTPLSKIPPAVLNEFLINVDEKKSAKFRNIFKNTTITFTSASQCRRWLSGPNFSYWPQQLNFAVWCATSGIRKLSTNYSKIFTISCIFYNSANFVRIGNTTT